MRHAPSAPSPLRRRAVDAMLALGLTVLLAACAAPGTGAPGALPAGNVAPAPVADPGRSCRVDADCVVKDVGSCCGVRPACVHRDSRPDPAAVAAACARDGVASTCGFVDVVACSCDGGTCRDQGAATSGWIRDAMRPGSAG